MFLQLKEQKKQQQQKCAAIRSVHRPGEGFRSQKTPVPGGGSPVTFVGQQRQLSPKTSGWLCQKAGAWGLSPAGGGSPKTANQNEGFSKSDDQKLQRAPFTLTPHERDAPEPTRTLEPFRTSPRTSPQPPRTAGPGPRLRWGDGGARARKQRWSPASCICWFIFNFMREEKYWFRLQSPFKMLEKVLMNYKTSAPGKQRQRRGEGFAAIQAGRPASRSCDRHSGKY